MVKIQTNGMIGATVMTMIPEAFPVAVQDIDDVVQVSIDLVFREMAFFQRGATVGKYFVFAAANQGLFILGAPHE